MVIDTLWVWAASFTSSQAFKFPITLVSPKFKSGTSLVLLGSSIKEAVCDGLLSDGHFSLTLFHLAKFLKAIVLIGSILMIFWQILLALSELPLSK